MKKFLGKAFCLAMACALLCGAIACSPKTPEETGESTTGGNGLIETGVAAEYLPQLSEIKKYSGTINVDMIFGKHEYGWKAVKQAFAGCAIVKKDKKVRNNLGLALIPQAGVAIGLAALGARTLGGASGEALETIILASSVLYELVGPALAKLSLYLSGSYSNKIEEIVEIPQGEGKLSDVDLLIRRIQEIQKEIPAREEKNAEDEKAFSEAAEEQYLAVRDKIKKFGGKK